MTPAQQRQYMMTYLKNQGTWKMAQLKKLTNEEIKDKFEALMRSIERFVPMGHEKEGKKRAGEELQTEAAKKFKSDEREEVSVPKEVEKDDPVKKEEDNKV